MESEQHLEKQVFDDWVKRFDPGIYDEARNFGVGEWSFVLSRRRRLLDSIESVRGLDAIEMVKQVVLETPLLAKAAKQDGNYGAFVSDLTCYYAWGMRGFIEDRFSELADACRSEDDGPEPFESEHERESEAWWDDLFESVRKAQSDSRENLLFGSFNSLTAGAFGECAFAEVDLSAPDELVIADFKRWLARIRKDKSFDHSPVGRFTDKELARWVSNRALPYIDLTLMARVLDQPLPHFWAGTIIFPGRDFDPAEKVRKTVAPLAGELLAYSMIEALKRAERKKSGD